MPVWGISANSHNAALAVFDNNQIVFASESERFSKIKNDPHLNADLLKYALQFDEPKKVYWYERPLLKTLRQIYAGQGFEDNNVKKYLKKYNIDVDFKTTSHHRSHAAAGYYTSNFKDACVLVIDAIGEFECFTQWRAQNGDLLKYSSLDYPHSLGLFYSAMTQRCGLKPNEEEYILMGMSVLGDSKRLFRDILDDFILLPNDEWGHPFRLKQNLHRGCRNWRPDLTSDQDRYDIAAATQLVYETVFERILQTARQTSSSRNLVLMGGCALNCSANSLAFKYFDNVWIMPAPGDNGSAIGAVLSHTKKHTTWPGPYLGYDMGYKSNNEEIVDYLINNKICGLARGRSEFGPRALGNRSLIADPRDKDIKDRVNDIKHRESFRPFAPAILEEFANQYFEMPTDSTPYMQYVVKCKNPERFPGIVHLDGTSRVQTVNKTDNPEFRDLLEKWFARTGCPMLLNTSLNIKGEPMINDHKDARNWTEKYGLPVFN
jgi:carbamoyltransferase